MTEYEKIYEETIKVVDYDREEYAKRLDYVLRQNMDVLQNLQNKLSTFKEGLVKEEKISKSIQNPKFRKPNWDNSTNNNRQYAKLALFKLKWTSFLCSFSYSFTSHSFVLIFLLDTNSWFSSFFGSYSLFLIYI